jgi:hypothetical protein
MTEIAFQGLKTVFATFHYPCSKKHKSTGIAISAYKKKLFNSRSLPNSIFNRLNHLGGKAQNF